MEDIKFIILDDIESDFINYGTQIKTIFEELSIAGNQILDNYSDVKELMRLYWDYINNNKDITKKRTLEDYITNKNAKANNIVYFIDDNWKNRSDNNDGSTFFKEFLLSRHNSINAIVLTVYTNLEPYGEMQYVCKNAYNVKADLKNRITNSNAYKQYQKGKNNPKNNPKKSKQETESRSTNGIPAKQAELISNDK